MTKKNFLMMGALFLSFALLSMRNKYFGTDSKLDGAWVANMQGNELSLLFADGYCMLTIYNKEKKQFIRTSGGPYMADSGQIKTKIEFNSADKSDVGSTHVHGYSFANDELVTTTNGFTLNWKRVDAGKENLAGNWRITQRKQDDKMVDIPLRARRTLKLLTATRFQWAAINIETGEFSGSGGGSYLFMNGKYTENIEFFSRDSSRVGMSLSFDGKIENGHWIHSGKSSKGDPIYEVWSRMK
ncbi:MAG TPA: hypothetical protein PK191_07585 [Niabella sp.]|nr:hypothetical protein [Niabella sp.]HOZ97617.1 hypothetical protein [Niabella sp.]HQW15755.1 hypothetical protein [Niabella sp.]HQX21030.1 hypothetical protein [Niabella sp.]HQX41873.1 hypothetical protein [Niabella sp.]